MVFKGFSPMVVIRRVNTTINMKPALKKRQAKNHRTRMPFGNAVATMINTDFKLLSYYNQFFNNYTTG